MSEAPEPRSVEHTEQVDESRAGIEQRDRVVTGEGGVEHRERSVHDVGAEHRGNILWASQLVWLAVGIIQVAIGLRVIMKLIAANPDNGFASFVYSFASVFLAPFFGLTGSPSGGGMVLEIPSLIAMLVYGVLGWLIVRVLFPLLTRPATRSTSTYDRYRS